MWKDDVMIIVIITYIFIRYFIIHQFFFISKVKSKGQVEGKRACCQDLKWDFKYWNKISGRKIKNYPLQVVFWTPQTVHGMCVHTHLYMYICTHND